MDERKILIHNATIVNEGESYLGYVVVDGEFIAAVGRGEPDQSLFDGAEAIDAKQHLLLPGVIDTHVHFRDPGLTHKADMRCRCRRRHFIHRHAEYKTGHSHCRRT